MLPFDPRLSNLVAKVLDSVNWSTLERLCLTGDNIDEWIQFLTKVDVPRLKPLNICEVDQVQLGLIHSSVLFVERLIDMNLLLDLYLLDIHLQDQHNWVILVEKIHPSMLGKVCFGGSSYDQLMSTQDEVDLLFLKEEAMEERTAGGF